MLFPRGINECDRRAVCSPLEIPGANGSGSEAYLSISLDQAA
jgi:hypothetical protein